MHNENYVDARLYKAAMFKMIAMNICTILGNYDLAKRYIRQQLKYYGQIGMFVMRASARQRSMSGISDEQVDEML